LTNLHEINFIPKPINEMNFKELTLIKLDKNQMDIRKEQFVPTITYVITKNKTCPNIAWV